MYNEQYYEKYTYYKNKYLKIKNKYMQHGSGTPATANIIKYKFDMRSMDEHFNPIYGLYMCHSGYLVNILLIYEPFINKETRLILPDFSDLQKRLLNNLFMDNDKMEKVQIINSIFQYRVGASDHIMNTKAIWVLILN